MIISLKEKTIWSIFFRTFLGIILAFAVCAVIIFAMGASPITAYKNIFYGVFGRISGIIEMLVKFIPILLIGLGVAVAFRCRFFNLGTEGQLWLGMIATTGLGLSITGMTSWLFVPLLMLVSFLCGAFWAFIPAWFKVKFGINEVVFTLMMNFIAILFGTYLFEDLWLAPGTLGNPTTPFIASSAWLPSLIGRLHIGILFALISILFVYVLVSKTVLGYSIRASGANPIASNFAGVNVHKNVLIAAIIGGGLAGLAGMIEICGLHHRLLSGISPGYGFSGITASVLGRLHPIGVTFAALFLAFLHVGTSTLQRSIGVPLSFVLIIEGLILMFVLIFGRR